MTQRQRWIYGNMQILKAYLRLSPIQPLSLSDSDSLSSISSHRQAFTAMCERLRYRRAHLSQLSAWVNFTGIFILLQAGVLLVMGAMLGMGQHSTALQAALHAVYLGYSVFLLRRLWAYYRDQSPLALQAMGDNRENDTPSGIKSRLRAWLIHLNFWELGALSWLPVLWNQKKAVYLYAQAKTHP